MNMHLNNIGKVVIYGFGEFRRDGELINTVNSCDVHEFDADITSLATLALCNARTTIIKDEY